MGRRWAMAIVGLVLCGQVLGQGEKSGTSRRVKESYWQVGGQAGLTQFYGELNNQDMQGVVDLSVSYHFDRRWALELDYAVGKLGGERIPYFNSYFITRFNEIGLLAQWNVMEQWNKEKTPSRFNIVLCGGLGLMNFNAKAYDIDSNVLQRFSNSSSSKRNGLFLKWGKPHGPSGIKNTHEGVIPLGMVLDFNPRPHWRLGMAYRFGFVRTDKLDATSGYRLVNPEESTSYSDTPNDRYSYLVFSVTYRFGSQKR
ncbi:hypothetical protein CLV98_109144 [Dyadobacter jejuensis]|uniref:Outer membrane protein with beta-barrel domain n=1 Tax=Dyadobacter jejuensis TaxID=1082580 RepID=A0A316AH19_9BACT|nr:hypothetical protein [Dyadobacter jejuensis]PWJ57035.1 hypothetical protein CLV98_109144 [Dyadobacter jejuensis]